MNYVKPLLVFVLGWVLLLLTPPMSSIAWVNGIAQLLLFIPVVCIPAWRTGRISYVDIGWPWGLVLIGVIVLAMSEVLTARTLVVSLVYLFIGLRMGVTALGMWREGHIDTELPRYKFQQRRWEKAGISNLPLIRQVEVLVQAMANASFLALPAFVIALNPSPDVHPVEWFALLLWVGAFAMESVADMQKKSFVKRAQANGDTLAVCNEGLWRYSRHPNYFAEWMVWNALVIAAIPSWWQLQASTGTLNWLLLGVGLLFTSRCMYITLVHYTGAKPAEYYSVQKRPAYATYQQRTNMFFPGPSRSAQ